jgi:F0F1-type ATP synthase gamma subunit
MREREVKEDIEFLETFNALARALQEVSMIKMQAVQNRVLEAREFHEGLAQTYKDVRITVKFDPDQKLDVITPTKSNIIVLLSANATMFGTLTDQVYSTFKDYVKLNEQDDIIILGKIGKDKFKKDFPSKEFKYFSLDDINKMYGKLLKIMAELIYYEKITIFYGRFVNMYSQEVTQKVLPGNMLADLLTTPIETQVTFDMLFTLEPTIKELEAFFAHQILGLLFRQSVYEFELARHAARVTSLESSLDSVEKQKKKMILLINKIKRSKEGSGISKTIAFFKKNHAKK